MNGFNPNNPANLSLTDSELDDLLGVYALDAIDDADERAAVDAYLLRSPRARAEVDAHRQVASALGNAAVAAPDELWGRISATLPAGVAPLPVVTHPDRRPPRTIRPRRRRTSSSFGNVAVVGGSSRGDARPWIAAAAAVSIAFGTSAFALSRNNALRSASAKNADLRSTVAVERARSSQLQSKLDLLARTSPVTLRLAELKRDPNVRDVQLLSTTGQPLGHVLLAPDGEGYILGDTLPMLSAGRTYQLWGVKDGIVLSLGVMGRSPKVMPFAADERWEQLVLTIESSPGVVSSKAGASAVAKLDQA